ncbi:MAG: ATP-binding protein [Coleofasciculaceae cyanobacterium]
MASISVLPFYQQLRKEQEKNLRFALHTRALTIKEFLSRAKDVTVQIASRTQARKVLEDYNQGRISNEVAVQDTTRILLDALNESQDVAGISRISQDNKLLAQLGLPIPTEFRPQLPMNSTDAVVSVPIQSAGEFYLVVTKPILNSAGKQAGADVVLFKASGLQNIVQDKISLDKTSEVILGAVNKDEVQLFFSPRNSHYQSSPSILKAISQAASGKSDLLRDSESLFKSKIVVFEPLANDNWGFVIQIESEELYASVHQQLVIIGIMIVLLSGLATAGMVLLLHPLSGQVLIQTDELKRQVQEKTAAIEQLKQTQAQLIQTEKLSSLGQLVAGVAHEINNPVNFIYGNLEHAEEYSQNLLELIELYQNPNSNSAKDIEEYIEEIDLEFLKVDLPKLIDSMQEGANRIRDIVLSLKNFSRAEEVGMKLTDLHEGLESTLLILQHRLKARPDQPEIQVIKRYGELPQVECHINQLNQVFMNLLANAIDALESNKQRHSSEECQANSNLIVIHTELSESNWVAIHIADNGAGMTQAVRNKLFEPFFTTKPVGKGTGLGLSVSYQIIVEHHGGKLWCDSTPGQGTEFTIQIPIRQEIVKGFSQVS